MIFGYGPFGYGPWLILDSLVTSLSVPNPLLSLLRDPLPRRSYLFYSLPYDPGIAARVTVKLGDGYASRASDTLPDGTAMAHALFRAGLVVPLNAQNSVMSGGALSSGTASQGDVVFELVTGRFRPYLSYDWDSAYTQILMGRPEWALAQFSPIFTGVTGPLERADTMEAHLPIQDNSYTLRKNIQPATYWGTGACLRFNSLTSTITYGDILDQGATSSFTVEFLFRSSTTGVIRAICGKKAALGTSAGWAINFNLGNNLFARIADGITEIIAGTTGSTGLAFLDGRMRRGAMVVDRTTQTIRLYVENAAGDDMTLMATSVSIAGIGSLANADHLRVGSLTGTLWWSGDIDDFRFYAFARSQAQIRADMHRELTVAGQEIYCKFNEGTGVTAFDSSGNARNGTITAGAWIGSLEGGTELAGQPPPVWEGVRRQVEPVVVDSQNYVYEVSRNPTVVGVSDVQDKGFAAYIMDASVADPYTWTPVAGHCVVAYMGGRTLLRFEAAPLGKLTVTVTSDTTDTAGIVKKLAKTYGGYLDAGIDLTAFTLISAAYPQVVGTGVRLEKREIWDMMQELALKAGGWVTTTRDGKLTIAILTAPTSPRFYLTENDIEVDNVRRTSLALAVKQTRLGYRPYQTVQTSELATSLSPAAREDLGKSLRYSESPEDTTVKARRANAEILEEDTLYDLESAAYAEAVRRQALWGVDRATFEFTLTRGLFQYAIGDNISVTVRRPDGTYEQNLNGWLAIVVGYVEDPVLETIRLTAWGALPS